MSLFVSKLLFTLREKFRNSDMAWWLVNGYSVRKDLGLGIVDLEYGTDIENHKILYIGLLEINLWTNDFANRVI